VVAAEPPLCWRRHGCHDASGDCCGSRTYREETYMFKLISLILVLVMLASISAEAGNNKTRNGALVGAGLGLVTGGGAGGAAKGALIGGGVGALASSDKGDKSRKYARNAAAVGAGVGLLTDGAGGAAKGAVYGAAAGALVGRHKDKKRR